MKIAVKKFTYIFLGAMIFTLVGCGRHQNVEAPSDAKTVSGIEGAVVINSENSSGNAEAGAKAATASTSTAEADAVDADVSEAGASIGDAGVEDVELSQEELAAKESYEYWDAYCNTNALDMTPMEGEFMTLNPEPEDAFPYMASPDGNVFGFYDDLTDGCSVWCAIDSESYVNEISATSTLAPQGNNTYEPANLGNRSRENAWVEGVEGYGIGESISIVRNYSHGNDVAGFKDYGYDSFFFPTLCIVNGLAKNEKAWKNNGRVKSLKLFFNDEYIATLELADSMKPQFISLSGLHLSARDGEDSTFRFEIADIYPGDKYEDTAITGIEIEVFTENH